MKNPALFTEEYWANSQLSVARYYGGCTLNGKEYKIVNKYGISVEELSNPLSKHYVGNGRYAIPPGEPADLVMVDWIPVYRKLGRDATLSLVKGNVPLEIALKKINLK